MRPLLCELEQQLHKSISSMISEWHVVLVLPWYRNDQQKVPDALHLYINTTLLYKWEVLCIGAALEDLIWQSDFPAVALFVRLQVPNKPVERVAYVPVWGTGVADTHPAGLIITRALSTMNKKCHLHSSILLLWCVSPVTCTAQVAQLSLGKLESRSVLSMLSEAVEEQLWAVIEDLRAAEQARDSLSF